MTGCIVYLSRWTEQNALLVDDPYLAEVAAENRVMIVQPTLTEAAFNHIPAAASGKPEHLQYSAARHGRNDAVANPSSRTDIEKGGIDNCPRRRTGEMRSLALARLATP